MTPDAPAGHELTMDRTLAAPVERVWAALTEEGRIAHWFGPEDDFRIEVLEWDCRVGGAYRVAMHHSGGQTHTCFGVFRVVEAPRRLAYTWSWEGQAPMDTLVTFEVEAAGREQTRLSFKHAGFPAEEVREQHRTGWTGSLQSLAKAVE